MTAKEYLSQAYQIEARIKIKMEHAQYYYDIATKANTIFSDIPFDKTAWDIRQIDGAIAHLLDLKNEMHAEISRLVALKSEIKNTINQVDNTTHQTLLELRYLHYMRWYEIAKIMHYESKYIFRLHNMALKKIDTIRDHQTA